MRASTEEDQFWRTVVAVALGILFAGVIGYFIRLWMVSQAVTEIQRSTAAIIESAKRESIRIQQQQAERAAAQARQAQEAMFQRRQAEAERQRASEAAAAAALAQAQAKEDAWKRYYRKPARCDTAEGDAFVECANQYIRAKRTFEKLYAAGKL